MNKQHKCSACTLFGLCLGEDPHNIANDFGFCKICGRVYLHRNRKPLIHLKDLCNEAVQGLSYHLTPMFVEHAPELGTEKEVTYNMSVNQVCIDKKCMDEEQRRMQILVTNTLQAHLDNKSPSPIVVNKKVVLKKEGGG